MNAVGYMRYSSDNQRDGYSIEAQKDAILEFAKKNDYLMVGFYIDEAKSGTNDKRNAFHDMMEDAKNDKFNMVIVHKLDRFARNKYDSVINRKKLLDNNVDLISVIEKFDFNNPEDKLMLSVIEGLSEYYSDNLSRETRKGMITAAKKGYYVGGNRPFGYEHNKETKSFEIVPEEAEIVKELFEKASQGMHIYSLERYCEEKGYKSRKGNPFRAKNILYILSNRRYTGAMTFRSYRKDSYAQKDSDERPSEIIFENAFEAIVSKEVFDQVQSMLATRKNGPMPRKSRKNNSDYFLTGFLYDGTSGKAMVGYSSKVSNVRKSGERIYYNYSHYRAAWSQYRKVSIKKAIIENFIIDSIRKDIFTEKGIEFVATKIMGTFDKRVVMSGKERMKLEDEFEKLETNKNRLLDIYLEKYIDKEQYGEKVKEIVARQSDIKSMFERAKNPPVKFTVDQIKDSLRRFLGSIDESDPMFKRRLVEAFIHKIHVYKQNIEITYKINIPDFVYNSPNGERKGKEIK